ncbi:MAG: hypothetical protein ACUVWX_06705 [Kiritimatiellia bacterium]
MSSRSEPQHVSSVMGMAVLLRFVARVRIGELLVYPYDRYVNLALSGGGQKGTNQWLLQGLEHISNGYYTDGK